MRLRNRFLLIALGIIIFSTFTPLLVLYARGFKFDFKTFQIIKTGSLVITTEPNKTQVLLNSQPTGKLTPATVRFLLPGDYSLTLRKDGYQDWSKRLSIKAQLATWANLNRDFVALFYSQPHIKNEIPGVKSFKTKSGNSSAYIKDSQMFLLEDDAIRPQQLGPVPNINIDSLIGKINFDGKGLYKIYTELLNEALPTSKVSQIQAIEANDRHLAIILNHDLYILNNNNLEIKAQGVEAIDLNNNYIWYVQKNTLTRLNINTGKTDLITSKLPDYTTSKIIHSENYLFVLLDQTLYRVNEELESIYSPVNYTQWDTVSAQIIFANDYEVMIYNPLDKGPQLILRSINPIKSPVYNHETGYIFFGQDGKIKTIEIDGRDHRNIFDITQTGADFSISESGEILSVLEKDEIKIFKIR